VGYVVKGLAMLLVIVLLVLSTPGLNPHQLVALLFLAALFIYRERYQNLPPLLIPEALIIWFLARENPAYLGLYTVTAYDLASLGFYYLAPLPALPGFFFLTGQTLAGFGALVVFAGISGFQGRILKKRTLASQEVYDRERRIRYSLEEAKSRLTQAAREAAHLAEIRERNRIAREIHDHVGHSLSGVLLQLQVVKRAIPQDPASAQEMLQNSITTLAQSVELIRDTVHNIKPSATLGVKYIQQIIENFKFCPVEFKPTGDFNTLSASHLEILSSIIKEALTNASRHSQASLIQIELEARENILRILIKDNGQGCAKVKEGLGLSGMQERVQNAGGTFSFTGSNGFMIVCVLPREDYQGGALEA
jgi:signal transduction histidine kinase